LNKRQAKKWACLKQENKNSTSSLAFYENLNVRKKLFHLLLLPLGHV
jgi:hypothetical protein